MDNEILYGADVTALKDRDRNNRFLRWFLTILFELIFLGILTSFFDLLFPLIGYFLILVIFFPAPFFLTPSEYKIIEKGVTFKNNKFFRFKKDHTLKFNEKRMFISIFRSPKIVRRLIKTEILRLYTSEPKKIHELLHQLLGRFSELP